MGAWFAADAAYSDGSFAIRERNGVKHLFLCLVSDANVVLEYDDYIRVVGQDCAYPVWLIKYIDCHSTFFGGEGLCPEDAAENLCYHFDALGGYAFYFYRGMWQEDFEHVYERFIATRGCAMRNPVATEGEVLFDAGSHRKHQLGRSDVLRGSRKPFQERLRNKRPYKSTADAWFSQRMSEKRAQASIERAKQKARTCWKRDAIDFRLAGLFV